MLVHWHDPVTICNNAAPTLKNHVMDEQHRPTIGPALTSQYVEAFATKQSACFVCLLVLSSPPP